MVNKQEQQMTFSPATNVTPTKQDLDYSVTCIKVVLTRLDELQAMPKYAKKAYDASFKYTRLQMEIGMRLHNEFIPTFNDRKRLLDAAYTANDVAAFEEHYHEIRTLLYRIGLTDMLVTAKKKVAVRFNVAAPYQDKLIRSLNWLVAVRDGSEETLKRMKMTPKERETADKRSAAMSARWGACC
jgi:hypothetical protein